MPAIATAASSSFCRLLGGVLAAVCAWTALIAAATPPPEPARVLTNIKDIRALSPEQAMAGLPVTVRGIITRITPYELFIQDGPDAIFIWQQRQNPTLRMGDYVQVTGVTNSGHLFPVIKDPSFVLLDHRPLPAPQEVRYSNLASERWDCQWVEVAGVVRTVETKFEQSLSLRILFEGALLRVEVSGPAARESSRLLGARLRLRGVISGAKTPHRKLIEPVLWVAYTPETFLVETPGSADVFGVPMQAPDTGHEFGGDAFSGEMVRVSGIVTSQPTRRLVFVRDQTQSLEIRLQRPMVLQTGDKIEAVGFPEIGSIQPILQHALVRVTASGPAPAPHRLKAAQMLDFRYEADLVEVEGELRDIYRHNEGLVMLLADEGKVFNVDLDAGLVAQDAILPPTGSRLSLVGICQIDRVTPPDRYQIVAPASVRLRLRSLEDVRVLSRPSWWTPRRLLTAVALLSVFALGALGWIWTLDRRVRVQTRIIIGGVQKEAMLEERNRIAREFHDTLEQQLAGATILLDAIATIVMVEPQRAQEELTTARAMLRHSLDEAQQAVADLRNNDLFECELKPLIEDAVRERLRATTIEADFHSEGTWPELDTVVKKHILRIVQESVTNAIKHAAPTRIAIHMLAAQDRLELQVVDNGCGFDLLGRERRAPGEFGLLGLQERAEKIGARLTIQSIPQQGTTIALSLRFNPAALSA